jgi:nitrous oxidase accessory protein NosD
VIDGGRAAPGVAVVRLDSHGAAIERLCVVASAWPDGRPGTAITVAGDRARVEGCRVDGAVEVTDGHDVEIVWNVVTAGGLSVSGAERTTVRGNRLDDRRAAVAIDLAGGHGHRVEANTVPDAHDGIRLRDCHGASVSANQVTGRRSAVHLDRCTACRITGNRATGMRAFSVSGGVANELTANVADGTDTGVLLERGAADTEISANHLTGCRVAILAWSHQGTSIGANRITASRDHDLVDGSGVGPDDGTAS